MITINNVLIATDFSTTSLAAMNYARELARTFNARLHVLHVVDDVSRFAYVEGTALLPPARLQTEIERTAAEELRCFISETDRRELRALPVMKIGTNAAKIIAEYAKEAAIDIVVIGATGRGMVDRLLMGSVADKVIRRAPCPVLAVHTPEREFIHPDVLQVVA